MLIVILIDFGNYDWYTMPGWGDDPATANIKELYDIDIISIDGGGNAAQRLSTMIVDGNLGVICLSSLLPKQVMSIMI